MPHLPAQSYIQLCASVIFTVLLNTPGVPEAIAAAGHDQLMFRRMVDTLRSVSPLKLLPTPPDQLPIIQLLYSPTPVSNFTDLR